MAEEYKSTYLQGLNSTLITLEQQMGQRFSSSGEAQSGFAFGIWDDRCCTRNSVSCMEKMANRREGRDRAEGRG